jgi:4-amino-4-deoxy-L-arabinose transferase-like glycosyltransferase
VEQTRGLIDKRVWLPLLIFIFALACRLVDFNATSVTYDECVAKDSAKWWQLLQKGNFADSGWAHNKGALVITRWLYGVLPEALHGENPSDPYQLRGARFISALLAAGLVVLIYFFGKEFGGGAVGVVSALAFSLFPAILGHDRIASHDLPARIASLLSVWMLVRFLKSGQRRDWRWSAIWAGVSFAAYFRVGVQTLLIADGMLFLRWLLNREKQTQQNFLLCVWFGLLALATGIVTFIVLSPYTWPNPLGSFWEAFLGPVKIAGVGAGLEWFFGTIIPVPAYYYPVIYIVMCPTLLLFAHLAGLAGTWAEARETKPALLLWLTIFIAVFLSFPFRSQLNHYLLICYPATCVLAAIGLKTCAERLARWRWKSEYWFTGLAAVMIGSQAVTALRIHPYHLEFFNALVGGTRSVAQNHTFMTGWYGEGIRPLFAYVNRAAKSNALVNCHFAAWPGISDLRRNLRRDLDIQGATRADPLGADYVLRAGIETCNQFYRCNPDPERYEKVMDVLALGGSIGDVWRRRPVTKESGLIYADDFLSPQVAHYAVGMQNFGFNPFSDGKLYPLAPSRPGGVMFRIPSRLLGNATRIQIQSQVQCQGGMALIRCGAAPTNLVEMVRKESFGGWLDTGKIPRPGAEDLWLTLEMITVKQWDGDTRSFWDYDWYDSLYVRAWE